MQEEPGNAGIFNYSRCMLPPENTDRDAAKKLAFLALLAGAVAVGASAIFVRLSELEALPSAFYRPFLAVPVLWLWLRLRAGASDRRRPATFADFSRLFLAGALFAGDLAFWHLSLHHTTVANATLFANGAPVFVLLAHWLIFRRRVDPVLLLGMGLALAGGACLVGGSLTLAPANLIGDFYGVVTALFLAGFLIAVERLHDDFGAGTIMLWTSAGTAAVLLPVALSTGETMIAVTAQGWLMLLGLAVISHAAGQGLVVYALSHLPATLAATGLLFEPVAAAFMAAVLLAEPISAWQAVGGGIILWGLFIARKGIG